MPPPPPPPGPVPPPPSNKQTTKPRESSKMTQKEKEKERQRRGLPYLRDQHFCSNYFLTYFLNTIFEEKILSLFKNYLAWPFV